MSIDVRLPQLADSDTKAKVSVWLKHEGDRVTGGEPLVEVETDKTTVEIEAPGSGQLLKIHAPEGTDGLEVGALLAVIAEDDAVVPFVEPAGRPAVRRAAESTTAKPRKAPPPPTRAMDVRIDQAEALSTATPHEIDATPLAAEMARLAGLDLAAIGRTSKGRVTKADVERALDRHEAPDGSLEVARPIARPGPPAASLDQSIGAFHDQPLSGPRRVTAARMQHAKQTIPHFYLEAECRADALVDLRAQLNAKTSKVRVTVTDFLVFVVARALKKVPLANAAWMETAVRVYESVDVAVAVNTPKGLITPILRACQAKTLGAISADLKDLTERARTGRLKPEEYTGGTFTLSNLGMFAVTSMTPIINPPHACILGVGAIEPRPVIVRDKIVAGQTMRCTLAADHRVIDGATAAELLAEIRLLIEDPVAVTLDL